jgi:transposase InsO family protein
VLQAPLYRVLAENPEVRERRNPLRHPSHPVPQLHATKPNELWSWDITKLHGPAKWTYFSFYVVLDVSSRYAVGWRGAHLTSPTTTPSARRTSRRCLGGGSVSLNTPGLRGFSRRGR